MLFWAQHWQSLGIPWVVIGQHSHLVFLVSKVGHLFGLGAPRVPQHSVREGPLLDIYLLAVSRVLHLEMANSGGGRLG
jgi:hypothetical protein